jgi:hypothetical protein
MVKGRFLRARLLLSDTQECHDLLRATQLITIIARDAISDTLRM